MAGNKIQLKRTSVPGRSPSNTDIDVGELAINLADNRLFTKNGANAIIDVHGQSLNTTANVTFRDGSFANIAATTLQGNLEWQYITSKPDLKIDIAGDATGNAVFTDLANSTITVTLANSGVTAGTYGNTSAIPVITVDAKGRITNVSTNTVAGVTGFTYTASNNTLVITAGDGSTYPATISTVNTFTVSNTLTVNGVATFANNVNITGNLNVTGTLTYVNTNVFQVSDEIVTLNADASGSPTANVGFEVNRGTSANTYLIWDEAADKWSFTNDGTTYLQIASNTDVATAYANAIAFANSINIADGITQLAVTNSGSSGYLFDQYTGSNPAIYVGGGETISFSLNTPGHPFLIRTSSGGANTTDGLTHVSTSGVISTGANAQGQTTGILYWKVPFSLVGNTYVYQCSIHGGMVGNIVITPPSSYFANASNITSGTLDTARLPATANISTAVNVGANVNLTTSSITVGNSTVNTQITATGITTTGSISTTNTLAAGNTTITGFANITSTLAAGNTTITGFANVNGTAALGNTTITGFANISSTLYVGGDTTINGNLIVNGNTVTINTTSLSVTDSVIYLASNNTVADTLDIGFVGHYNGGSGANGHTGLIRSAVSKKYYLFQNYQPEFLANNNLDYANGATGIEMADIVVGNLVANSTLLVTGNATFSNSTVTTGNATFSNTIAVTGNATFSNTIAVTGAATFSNNVTITGNLTVTGSTTYVNTNIFQVSDEIIVLNADASGSATANVGFEVNRGTDANTALIWDEVANKWSFTNDGTTYYQIASNTDVTTAYTNATSYADARAANAYSNAVSYAGSIAATAYSNAVSTAAADATSKAATAYSNAVSTAAADATSKAATAYSNATSYADTKAATAYSNATSYADTKAATAYSNAIAYAAANTYVNTTFAPLAGATFTGAVAVNSTFAAGNTTITGFANVNGTAALGNTTITGFANVTSTLQVGANVTLGDTRIVANGGVGSAGQVLTSGGTTGNVYWSTVTGGGGGGSSNTFATISISGQSDVIADSTTDTLTLAAGNNVTITTDASTDTITFVANNTLFTLTTASNTSSANISLTGTGLTANTIKVIGAGGVNVNSNGSVITIDGTNVAGGGGGGSTNSFGTIAVSGQTDVIADQANDTLTFVAGSGMTITTNPAGDTITFTSSGGGGSGTGTGTAFIAARDNFTANGTQTAFTLSTNATANSILVAVDGLIQFHTEDYDVSGTTLTFTTAPANNEVIEILHISGATNYLFQQYAAIDSFSGNGSNTVFTLTRSANNNTSQVYLDGLLQNPNSDYTVSGTTLTFTTAPLSAEEILVYHTESSSGNPHLTSIAGTDTFAGDDTTTNFTLSATANSSTSFVTINGLVQRYTTDYTLSGTTLSFVVAPPSGSAIQAWRLTGSLGVTYKTIQVSGQSDIVADQADDILTFANGAGITITTSAATDTITIAQSAITKQSLTGNGSNTIFTLDTSTTEDNILVFVDGIYFHPTDDYTVSGTTLTFAAAPINSAEIRIRYMR